MNLLDFSQNKGQKKLAILWGITFLILFPLLIVLGLLMRMEQGQLIAMADPNTFYALMTLHGLGMAGVLFSVAFSGLWYLIATRVSSLKVSVGYLVYVMIVIGALGLTYATLMMRFAAGWYMLYPLPFKGASWSLDSIKLASLSLLLMGLGWLVGILHLLYSLSKRYGGFFNLLGWQYLGRKKEPKKLPSIVLIATVSLVPGVIAFLAGAVLLILYLLQSFEPAMSFNPLMLKNLTFFFGHTLVNITLYCGVGWVYALLPEFTGREWKTDKVIVWSWNATFFFILFAYFHHLYMDFAQPLPLQYLGQFASYFSAIPATAITMFSVIAQFYHSKVKWNVFPLMVLLGMTGWAIGGFSAVIDSTIAFNRVLHNTLWVPAHFHTYMLAGVVLFILAYLFYLFSGKEIHNKDRVAKTGLWIFIIGASGFLSMFYLGGMFSVPRRFANYTGIEAERVKETGALLAKWAVLFISIVLVGLLVMYVSLISKLFRKEAIVVEAPPHEG